jgi:hypothetical protein
MAADQPGVYPSVAPAPAPYASPPRLVTYRRGPDRGRAIGLVVVVGLLVAAVGAVVVRSTGASWYPEEWDTRVADIVDDVERLRGLEFKHPVHVRFVNDDEFENRVGFDSSQLTDGIRDEIDNDNAVLRALGFFGPKDDLFAAFDTVRRSGALALYSPSREEIVVRGNTVDVARRVTLVHELTHALQDQHFDIETLQNDAFDPETGDSDGLRALIEGDATRIEYEYLELLSETERDAHDLANRGDIDRFAEETQQVPDIVQLIFAAPYEFGTPAARVLAAEGGDRRLDSSLQGPTPSSRLLVQPGVLRSEPPPAPSIPEGATEIGSAEPFSHFELYLTLANGVGPSAGLDAADAIEGGRAVTYEQDDQVCIKVAFTPRTATSAEYLVSVLEQWAAARPNVTVDDSEEPGFIACDPGAKATTPAGSRFRDIVALLQMRTTFTVEFAEAGLDGELARCIARVLMHDTTVLDMLATIATGRPSPAQLAQMQNAAARGRIRCDADVDTELR